MSATVPNLEERCTYEDCDVGAIGDHTMRQWTEHAEREVGMMDYEEDPLAANPATRLRVAGLEDYTVCDGLVAKSAVADLHSGQMRIVTPVMLFDFALNHPSQPPRVSAKVAFVGTPDVMRKMARLLGDTARGAANAAEKGRR